MIHSAGDELTEQVVLPAQVRTAAAHRARALVPQGSLLTSSSCSDSSLLRRWSCYVGAVTNDMAVPVLKAAVAIADTTADTSAAAIAAASQPVGLLKLRNQQRDHLATAGHHVHPLRLECVDKHAIGHVAPAARCAAAA